MPPFDIDTFRQNFPEFSNAALYPTATINFWAGLASKQVLSSVWKDTWIYGVSLYVAHEIIFSSQNVKASAVGGVPGMTSGIANSKAVGSVNVSYDTTSTAEKDGGYWNQTTYGKQFFRLVKIFGAGCIQL